MVSGASVAERRRLRIGARIAGGALGAGATALVVAVAAFLPLPTLGPDPRAVTVDPAPADQLRVCPGAAMRVGDESGENADAVFAIGAASAVAAAPGSQPQRTRLASADPSAAAEAAPEAVRAPPADGSLLGGAQIQDVDAPGFRGLASALCAEPRGSTWLVGGATTVGRSAVLLLANPTDVPSRVSVEIFGEAGRVGAPGMSGIEVPAHGQLVLSLAGFAPGVASPIVHVTARGGRIVATLQHSIVRGLDAVGVETVGAGADPGERLVVPGVRLVDTVGVNRASALADWQDAGPVLRLVAPGDTAGRATVHVVPETPGAIGTSFELDLEPGTVTDAPLDSGAPEGGPDQPGAETEAHGVGDGIYTVFIDADVPVVGGVRASTAVDTGVEAAPDTVPAAPASDLAWFGAAPPLHDDALVVVPDGPSPLVSIANPTGSDAAVELAPLDGAPTGVVTVPARGSVSVAVAAGTRVLSGVAGLSVTVSFAAPGALASFVASPARPVAAPIVVHPD